MLKIVKFDYFERFKASAGDALSTLEVYKRKHLTRKRKTNKKIAKTK
jgi:hypothetical protein